MTRFVVGFTGTFRGLSTTQRVQLRRVLTWLRAAGAVEFRHGDAVGADTEAAELAADAQFTVTAWPPRPDDASPLVRNRRDIVNESAVLIAAPRTDVEVVRSGTWATVRYARAARIPVIFLSRGKKEMS